MNSQQPSNMVPITVGIIGHRDLLPDEMDRVRSQVRSVVLSYRAGFPDCPILLVSTFAESADQVVMSAIVGLEEVEVVALLPMEQNLYEKDFDSAALGEFRSLLEGATIVLAEDFLPDDMPDRKSLNGEIRDLAYQRCSYLLSKHVHVLIAAWDGRPPKFIGGTADTVFERCGVQVLPGNASINHLWLDEAGVLLQIPVGRMKHGQRGLVGGDKLGDTDIQSVGPSLATGVWNGPAGDKVAAQLDELNRDLGRKPANATASVTERILQVADERASAIQARFRGLTISVLSVGVGFLMAVNLEQNLGSSWLIASALAMLTLTAILWWFLSRSGINDRYQQFRALAEGARVQLAWLQAGVKDCPSDYYLISQPDFAWIRRALRSAWFADRIQEIQVSAAGESPANLDTRAQAVGSWIDGQLEYFLGTPGQPGAIARNRRNASRCGAFAVLGLVVALAGFGLDIVQRLGLQGGLELLSQALWELGLGAAAASAAFGQLMAYTEVARQLETSAEVFAHGRAELDRVGYPARTLRIAQQVGTAALAETSTWIALKRDRAIRPL